MNDTTESSTPPEEPIGEQLKHRMAGLVGALRGKGDDEPASPAEAAPAQPPDPAREAFRLKQAQWQTALTDFNPARTA